MDATGLKNIFIIPHSDGQYIVYLPLSGIIFSGNSSAINLFHNALNGDKSACEKFGLTESIIAGILKSDQSLSGEINRDCTFRPTELSLFLTTGCTMKCAYCYASSGEKESQISWEYIEVAVNEIIKNATETKNKKITVNYHGGGDIGAVWPLVEETTEYIKKLAKENGLKVIFTSGLNGVLSDYQREWIVCNFNSATVSLDGYSDIQNMLRPLRNGGKSFDIVHETLKYFDSRDFNYGLRSTVTNYSVKYLEDIVTFFCCNYNAKKIKMEPVFIQGRAIRNSVCMPLVSDFVEHFLKGREIASCHNRELLYSGARFDLLTNIFCMAAGSSFGVTPEGYLTSCYEVLEKSNPASETFFYGKIENGTIIVDYERIRKLKNLTVMKKAKCEKCFAKFHCAGDCPVKSILSENNEFVRDYRCTINRELTKDQLLRSIQ